MCWSKFQISFKVKIDINNIARSHFNWSNFTHKFNRLWVWIRFIIIKFEIILKKLDNSHYEIIWLSKFLDLHQENSRIHSDWSIDYIIILKKKFLNIIEHFTKMLYFLHSKFKNNFIIIHKLYFWSWNYNLI